MLCNKYFRAFFKRQMFKNKSTPLFGLKFGTFIPI